MQNLALRQRGNLKEKLIRVAWITVRMQFSGQ